MEGPRSRARSRVEELAAAWLAGDYDTVSSACTSDVRWWSPAADGTARGPADTGTVLREVLAPLERPVEISAVIPSDDGTRCVVEMRSAATPHDARPSFLTSVLTLRDGKVSEGRTYSDLRQAARRPEAS